MKKRTSRRNDTMPGTLLPAPFSALESIAPDWALATQNERQRKRASSTPEELQAFYKAMFPEAERAIEYLNKFSLDDMPEEAKRLLGLTLALAEVAPHVELYRSTPWVPYSFDEDRFIAEHGNNSHYLGNLYGTRPNDRRGEPW
jgi:hypothetical protein